MRPFQVQVLEFEDKPFCVKASDLRTETPYSIDYVDDMSKPDSEFYGVT